MVSTVTRHVIETCHSVRFCLPAWQAATVYAHCVCGWKGPHHVLQPHAPDVAQHAAELDGDQHLARPDEPADPSPSPSKARWWR